MFACLDVHYTNSSGAAAALTFHDWTSSSAHAQYRTVIKPVAPYEPGMFFKRELPCLLAVIELIQEPLDLLIVDGYVWLDRGVPGLGSYLYDTFDREIPVVGVAKTTFRTADGVAAPCRRGKSDVPLWITAAGIDSLTAAEYVKTMHGPYRLPTLLKQVDTLARHSNDLPA